MTASHLLDSSSYLNLLQRMFWRLPRLSQVIHKEHATTIQFLQSRGREQQYLGRGGMEDMLESFLSLQPWTRQAGPQSTHLGTVSGVTVCRDGLSTSIWSRLLLRRYLDAAWRMEGKGLAQREGRQPAQTHSQEIGGNQEAAVAALEL